MCHFILAHAYKRFRTNKSSCKNRGINMDLKEKVIAEIKKIYDETNYNFK